MTNEEKLKLKNLIELWEVKTKTTSTNFSKNSMHASTSLEK